jgi:hypothetical protein|uniref:Uncharacterized protein n=1 Tax=viral metagenome TaxID=1070528 RepID=A0A6C0ASV4_9ZZZZ
MEKRVNKKIETYVTDFKNGIRDKINELQFDEKAKMNELIEYVYDYTRLSLIKDDLVKRKRIKNSIPQMNRCSAKRASGEQCTRRRKDGCEFCGTHAKGTPHGLAQVSDSSDVSKQKVEVIAEEICGIVYYIDAFHNVYCTEDIMEGKQNPRVVAKYEKCNGRISIPDLGIN